MCRSRALAVPKLVALATSLRWVGEFKVPVHSLFVLLHWSQFCLLGGKSTAIGVDHLLLLLMLLPALQETRRGSQNAFCFITAIRPAYVPSAAAAAGFSVASCNTTGSNCTGGSGSLLCLCQPDATNCCRRRAAVFHRCLGKPKVSRYFRGGGHILEHCHLLLLRSLAVSGPRRIVLALSASLDTPHARPCRNTEPDTCVSEPPSAPRPLSALPRRRPCSADHAQSARAPCLAGASRPSG